MMWPWYFSFQAQHSSRKLLATDFLAAGSFVPQFLLDLELGGDAGVVGAGNPQRRPAAHPLVADHQVFQRHEQGVPLVQDAGDVGRGDGDHEGFAIGVPAVFRLEPAVFFPPLVESSLGGFEVVGFGEGEVGHVWNLWRSATHLRGASHLKTKKPSRLKDGRLRGATLVDGDVVSPPALTL